MIRNQKTKITKLAQQGAQVQLQQTGSITDTMRRFCEESKSWTSPPAAAASPAATSMPFNPPRVSQRTVKTKMGPMEKAKKLIGIKKTLVNQLRGLKNTAASNLALRKTYKVLGETRHFSSSSSMLARCPSSLVVIDPRRCLSLQHKLMAKHQLAVKEQQQQQQYPYRSITQATTSATQRGFNQGYNHHADVVGQMAKEIGDAIKEELMVIDDNTKQILKYNGNEFLNRQKSTDSFSYDPLHGWNHPRALNSLMRCEGVTAPANAANAIDEEIARRAKPRQRRQLYKNFKIKSSDGLSEGKVDQMQSSPTNERLSDFRYGNRKMSATNTTISYQQENRLLNKPSKTTMRTPREEKEDPEMDRYKQPQAERQFLEKTIMRKMDKADSHMRLDDIYYPKFGPAGGEARTGVASPGAESAAQRVISKQIVDVLSQTGNIKKRGKLARHTVDFVDPVPKLKPLLGGLPSEPAFLRRRVTRPAAPHYNVKKTIIRADNHRPKRNQTMRPLVMPVYHNTPIASVQKTQSKLDRIMSSTKKPKQEKHTSPMSGGQKRFNKKKSTKSVKKSTQEWEMVEMEPPSTSKQTFYIKESAVQRVKAACPRKSRGSHVPYVKRANQIMY
ncbi:uncharacterized protein Dwil_GK26801 [Drosophila willistoni]|uniref:Uncharacterized protein n=1 Tax=Drosophila willistoni TaxID=7260 RepID=A0A0Q9X7L7_DROWI|nr:uncharacterized protein LOC26528803 [Drosophila willistoni]KRG00120.1 uncharacterized protein Dwil_GK26801 [Drosophila willistoni]